MQDAIHDIYQKGSVTGQSGVVHSLHSAIDPTEGQFLADLIEADTTVRKTLEVGCAYGLSSLFICLATRGRPGASHTILDPFQNTQWDGVGVKNLKEAGIDFFTLMEERSEFGLPELLKGNEGSFDFIFIDGFHTFDHTMLDCFYANRLLRVGGYLVIDDVGFPAVNQAVSFLKSYPCYRMHGSLSSQKRRLARKLLKPLPRGFWSLVLTKNFYGRVFNDHMVALCKICEDERPWDWHAD